MSEYNYREDLRIESQKEDATLFEGLPQEIVSMVVKPKHYFNNGFSPIELMDTIFTEEMLYGYMIGNMIKYITRYKDKEKEIQDLAKVLFHNSYIINYTKGKIEDYEGTDTENELFYLGDRVNEDIKNIFAHYIDENSKNKGSLGEQSMFESVVRGIESYFMEANTRKDILQTANYINKTITELILYKLEEEKENE